MASSISSRAFANAEVRARNHRSRRRLRDRARTIYRFRPPVNWIAADILRIEDGMLAEHWDVIQDEATCASKSGLPMFGDTFPVYA